ncbi:AbrB/MazE/SpoVT family DNA-binding domain-containing protein [Sphingomonas sp. SUN019]|uniref:AbrB/MazE/SpoVT family DNA-binding domain-containing protein n=1 Tax=Sphingomonas sp. SUN019 TaxID=2937788 RepID=UPI002164D199|nr:AbrB/MazE/SpoVT family DNA-binding domain-containing protein [Sphingomonas sp. SUN019]UVO50377.1 AbrB/MazE/SpoVT family DNA-binding domain-containing protein [Sphingomonas sp. SUN019]
MNAPFLKPPRALKVIKVGNSLGVILPKEVLAKLGVEMGDALDLVDEPDGFRVRRHDAVFAEQMKVAREVMKRRRDALAELAK